MIFQCDDERCTIVWANAPTSRRVKGRVAKRTCPDCVGREPAPSKEKRER